MAVSAAAHWRFAFWLVFDSNGKVRQTVREPDISRTERKMLVYADLPKSLWSSPELKATIRVTEDNREPEFEIDLAAAGAALRGALGVDIDMRVVPPPAEESEEEFEARVERERELRSMTEGQ